MLHFVSELRLYSDIKNAQPTKKAFFEPADHSLSSDDNLFTTPHYGSYRSWLNFQKEILRFARERNWIVVTDIANYYDFINYTHLRNVIAGTIKVRETIPDFLIFVLSSILWQPDYTPRFEIGLPQINADAPRILAHCFLFELDKVLAESKHIDYARFMDDIDLGVDTLREAKQLLKQIDLVLQTRQVRLNSGKTKILSQIEAEKHFIASHHISDILRNWPSTRENAMRYFLLMPHDKAYFQAMIRYIAEEHYIDDVSWLDFARAMSFTPRFGY